MRYAVVGSVVESVVGWLSSAAITDRRPSTQAREFACITATRRKTNLRKIPDAVAVHHSSVPSTRED